MVLQISAPSSVPHLSPSKNQHFVPPIAEAIVLFGGKKKFIIPGDHKAKVSAFHKIDSIDFISALVFYKVSKDKRTFYRLTKQNQTCRSKSNNILSNDDRLKVRGEITVSV